MAKVAEEKEQLGWCVVELMGHRRLGGYCSERTVASLCVLAACAADRGQYADRYPDDHKYHRDSAYRESVDDYNRYYDSVCEVYLSQCVTRSSSRLQ